MTTVQCKKVQYTNAKGHSEVFACFIFVQCQKSMNICPNSVYTVHANRKFIITCLTLLRKLTTPTRDWYHVHYLACISHVYHMYIICTSYRSRHWISTRRFSRYTLLSHKNLILAHGIKSETRNQPCSTNHISTTGIDSLFNLI